MTDTEQVAMIKQASECFLRGDIETCKSILEYCITNRSTWTQAALDLGIPNWRCLRQCLSPNGNPTSKRLSAIIDLLVEREGVVLRVGALPFTKPGD